MYGTSVLVGLLAAGHLASAHMEMQFPPPFRSKYNSFATNIDYSMTAPLSASGSDFPCKGYHKDLGTPAGASVTTFAPGSKYNFTITGGAAHNGGSCQAALSYDKGATFTVIASYEGNCPVQGTANFDFTMPSDAPAGAALFSWSWNNKVGNREYYMNCASVTIGAAKKRDIALPADLEAEVSELTNPIELGDLESGGAKGVKRDGTAFSARPALFVANIGNGCNVAEGIDVRYPSPGPDLIVDPAATLGDPTGSCGAAAPGGSSGSGSGAASSAAAAPATSAAAAAPAPASTSAAAVAASSSAYVPHPASSLTLSNVGLPSASAASASAPASAHTTAAPSAQTSAIVVVPLDSHSASASSSLPGGVFITNPGGAATSSAAAAQPTTLATSTKASSAAAPLATGTSAAAAPAPTGSGSGSGSGSGGGAAGSVGAACTDEGAWNCIDGKSFSRCASGTWSAVIQMAAGTSCAVGVSDTLKMGAARRVVRRGGSRRAAWAA